MVLMHSHFYATITTIQLQNSHLAELKICTHYVVILHIPSPGTLATNFLLFPI